MNPQVLRWARMRAGLSVSAAATAIGRSEDAIEAWESGDAAPTYRQLADLAHRVYKRPIAVFFFPAPPEEQPITSEFRTLPDADRDQLEPDTLYALRDARAWQLSAGDVFTAVRESFRGNIADLRAHPRETPAALAARIRELLGITVAEQLRWREPADALKAWRVAVEQFSVLVFKRPFKQETVSGFCLDHPAYPVIVLNNSTSHTRQIFTLFHELGHLAYGVSGLTVLDENLGSLAPPDRRIEVACNQFAADLLVPPNSINLDELVRAGIEDGVIAAAQVLNVSREVILRRLLDTGRVDADSYTRLVAEWHDDYLRRESNGGGGSYYANVGTYISDSYARAVLHQYHTGRITLGDAADHLRMKAQNLDRFEAFLLSRGKVE